MSAMQMDHVGASHIQRTAAAQRRGGELCHLVNGNDRQGRVVRLEGLLVLQGKDMGGRHCNCRVVLTNLRCVRFKGNLKSAFFYNIGN